MRPAGAGGPGKPPGSARPGQPSATARLDVLATLKAAAPLQRLRGGNPDRLQVRADDFRLRRCKHKQRTTTIFVVDASGSAAVQRLAEVKVAIELLTSQRASRRCSWRCG